MVYERNSSDVGTVPHLKPVYSNAAVIPPTLNHAHRGKSSVNEQGAQVAVSPLADAQKHIATSAGVLARYEAQPGAQFSSVPEFMCIADGSDQRSCDQRTDTFNPGQTLHRIPR
jgi:hypothetical protein